VFFFVDHQRRIEIMKLFLPLCKSFEEKNQNKAKKSSGGPDGEGGARTTTGLPDGWRGEKATWNEYGRCLYLFVLYGFFVSYLCHKISFVA
jgi:hypothetical protein